MGISKKTQTYPSYPQNAPDSLLHEVHSACRKILYKAQRVAKSLQTPVSTLMVPHGKVEKIGFICHKLNTSPAGRGEQQGFSAKQCWLKYTSQVKSGFLQRKSHADTILHKSHCCSLCGSGSGEFGSYQVLRATMPVLPLSMVMTVQTVQAGKHPSTEFIQWELRRAKDSMTIPSLLAHIILV